MRSKIVAAEMAAAAGIPTVIADGRNEIVLAPILAGEADMVTGYKQGVYEKAFVSGIYNALSRSLFHVPVRDLNNVKAYRREIMADQPARRRGHPGDCFPFLLAAVMIARCRSHTRPDHEFTRFNCF